jgi:hypothetical protein
MVQVEMVVLQVVQEILVLQVMQVQVAEEVAAAVAVVQI